MMANRRWGLGLRVSVALVVALGVYAGLSYRAGRRAAAGTTPALYYGPVMAGGSFTPAVGQAVTAWIGGTLCGQTQTVVSDGQIVYSILVLPDAPGGLTGCGDTGRIVDFKVNGQAMTPDAVYGDAQVQYWPLNPLGPTFTPTPTSTSTPTATPIRTPTPTPSRTPDHGVYLPVVRR